MMHLLVCTIGFLLIHPLDSTLSKSDAKKKKSTNSAAIPPCDTLVSERGLVTEKPTYKDILQNHLAYSLPHATNKHFPLTTLAFVTPANSNGYSRAKTFRNKFSLISPAWLHLSPAKTDTGFTITGDQLIPQDWIRVMNSVMVPRLVFEGWTSQDFNRLFANEYVASGCCQTVVRHLKKLGLSGVTLDVWAMLMGHRRPDLVHFVQHLGREMRASGLLLVLLAPAPLGSSNQPSGIFDRNDFDSLFDYVDFFALGPFDFAQQQQPAAAASAGPVAPVAWLRACVEALAPAAGGAASAARRAKILLPVNFYGYDHVPGHPQMIDGQAYLAVLKKHRPDLLWSPEHREHFFTYSTGIGRHMLSYPTLASVKFRLDLAHSLGTGIAIWDVGQGLDYFFDLL